LKLVPPNEIVGALAEIGAIFLLLTVGLEIRPRDILEIGWTASLVAILGILVPFVLGYIYMKSAGHALGDSVFLAAAMVGTSVGITARVLQDAGALVTPVARVILAAALLDDIVGMIVLAIVTSLSEGRVHYVQLAIVAAEAIGFSLLMVFFGARVVGHLQPTVARLGTRNSAFVLSVLLCLGLSLASVYIGMAAIIGAFLAGLALADHSEEWRLRESIHPVYEFLGPFFFVFLGAQVNLQGLAERGLLWMLSVVCVLAILSKLFGCGLGALSLGVKDALRVGVGMVPRGEVGLIIAAVGLSLHAISDKVYSVVLLMSMATTLFAPPVLRLLLPRPARAFTPREN
ncbi:MAG TPA: cation:proton antiporter, partial [Candidatus Acidoferrales bacterium]|nr:cation:proton antiporter [Candidatus Acidoferrales bacterium]